MSPIRILLADDHAVVRAGIRQFLERVEDFQVVAEAEDGASAKLFVRTLDPDVAVLDIQMPEATGIEVTRWIRSEGSRMGVLILTAYDDDPYVMAVLRAGANGFVLKTASPDEIIQAVRDVHEGKSAFDPAIAQKLVHQISDLSSTAGRLEAGGFELLTEREEEVLELAGRGFTNKAIAVQLGISDRTVQGHLAKVFVKLRAESRTEAVMRAVSLGLISVDLSG